ncbi:FAD-dependent oxidoreductase [Campylobacter fetus]|uniref:dihydrolipoyl dehydrogenase family protein n=1 Tax=Campylobacter fetus TaxID=196 RepID=UPI0005090C4B|nr:FAD-dependent oxidoreductase [Campylobacter fetus]WKW17009.1 FAD-dependent oxidoreductase [Campylobacter fetus subsp. fetus]AIR79255.1 pyridine nucleotide-disulfide oxidoreductase [Campylobacter fetus subsp. fetus 04/554]EAJ5704020.1 NAD(P)/FAD-dependent oxidoreductase [Campylobacter fetus]EAJ9256569.1 NAD(P)/FAD-dependent oxidoreductase [Campylobacter fetus]EAK0815507.1 NAD(P)/FAD-dependent oxidoreductase [Campylobacter fetus]
MKYDLIIIGFGKAGKTLAAKAATLGKKVALIEKSDKMYGGTCINIGCIPTKKLVTLSKDAKFFSDRNEYFCKSMEAKDTLVSALRAKNYGMLNDNPNVTLIKATAKFKDENTILADGEELSAPIIVINTGSKEKDIPFEVKSNQIYTSTAILNLKTLPKHLIVLGMGFIGLEFASMFANFGSKVTIMARKNEFLPDLDNDTSSSVKEALQTQGIEIILGSKFERLNGDTLSFNQNGISKNIKADAFLAAFGRTPAIDELSLQNANIAVGDKCEVLVNDHLQTTIPHIYAVGDCKGGPEFTYISLDDYRIVFNHIFGDKTRSSANRSVWATTTFMDTELSQVGKSEKELSKHELKIAKVNLSSVPMAKVLAHDTGFMKAIVDKNSDEILGITLHCKNANEIINMFSLAMENKIKASKFKSQIFTHPSISEAINDLFSQI